MQGPTERPTVVPSISPTESPTVVPSLAPSVQPSAFPTMSPSVVRSPRIAGIVVDQNPQYLLPPPKHLTGSDGSPQSGAQPEPHACSLRHPNARKCNPGKRRSAMWAESVRWLTVALEPAQHDANRPPFRTANGCTVR
jgi:hypothetical protein